ARIRDSPRSELRPHPHGAGTAEDRLELRVTLLVDGRKPGALVRTLRGRVADEIRDLRLAGAGGATPSQHGAEQLRRDALAARGGPQRDPLDDPAIIGRVAE